MNTSAYADIKFYKKVTKAAGKYHLSISRIFRDLLDLTCRRISPALIKGMLTEYQRHKPESWERLHFCPNEEQIEVYSNIRQKLKISVSKLAFFGFLLFWEELLEIYETKTGIPLNENDISNYEEFKSTFTTFLPYIIKRLNINIKTTEQREPT